MIALYASSIARAKWRSTENALVAARIGSDLGLLRLRIQCIPANTRISAVEHTDFCFDFEKLAATSYLQGDRLQHFPAHPIQAILAWLRTGRAALCFSRVALHTYSFQKLLLLTVVFVGIVASPLGKSTSMSNTLAKKLVRKN
jgi:hypothetical protein